MRNNQSYCVQGIGDISFKVHDSRIKMLANVRYVLGLKRNLISLGTLDELGYSYKVENGFMHVFKNKNLILTGIKKHGLYVLNGYSLFLVNIPTAYMVKADKADLCYLRLGHMSQKGLGALSNQGYISPVPSDPLNFCESCILSKQHRMSFHKGTHLAKVCLEYVRADLWGPSQMPTLGGNKYFLSIVDDFTSKVWVFLLKTKDQT